jgi:hypothetical protein
VTTVGGTVTGLYGAAAASQAIVREGGFRRALLPVNSELALHWAIRAIWNRFGEEEYAALLRAMDGRLRAVLQSRNRDRWFGALWPVLAAQPQMLALAARAALRP